MIWDQLPLWNLRPLDLDGSPCPLAVCESKKTFSCSQFILHLNLEKHIYIYICILVDNTYVMKAISSGLHWSFVTISFSHRVKGHCGAGQRVRQKVDRTIWKFLSGLVRGQDLKIWGFQKWDAQKWMVYKGKSYKNGWFGVPLFQETTISQNLLLNPWRLLMFIVYVNYTLHVTNSKGHAAWNDITWYNHKETHEAQSNMGKNRDVSWTQRAPPSMETYL